MIIWYDDNDAVIQPIESSLNCQRDYQRYEEEEWEQVSFEENFEERESLLMKFKNIFFRKKRKL